MNKNWLNFLGIVLRAGGIISGEEMVVQSIRSSKARFVILAEDISPNTFKKVTDKCKFYKVDWVQAATSAELGHALGKDFRKVVAITDPHLAKALKGKIPAQSSTPSTPGMEHSEI